MIREAASPSTSDPETSSLPHSTPQIHRDPVRGLTMTSRGDPP